MYMSFDTEEICTEEEIRVVYNGEPELLERFPNFDDYMDYLMGLGRDKIGGIIEV